MAKRYVLLIADEELTDEDTRLLAEILGKRYGKVGLIPVDANPKALVVKTTNVNAPQLRETAEGIRLRGNRLRTVLTSGSIGRLKRQAAESRTTASGEVS